MGTPLLLLRQHHRLHLPHPQALLSLDASAANLFRSPILISPNTSARFSPAAKAISSATASPAAVAEAPASDVKDKGRWKAVIDLKWMSDNRDAVAANIRNRNFGADLNLVIRLYEETLDLQKVAGGGASLEGEECGGEQDEREAGAVGKNLKDNLSSLEDNLLKLTDKLQQEAQCIPNLTHPDTPIGDEDHSIVRKTIGSPLRVYFSGEGSSANL